MTRPQGTTLRWGDGYVVKFVSFGVQCMLLTSLTYCTYERHLHSAKMLQALCLVYSHNYNLRFFQHGVIEGCASPKVGTLVGSHLKSILKCSVAFIHSLVAELAKSSVSSQSAVAARTRILFRCRGMKTSSKSSAIPTRASLTSPLPMMHSSLTGNLRRRLLVKHSRKPEDSLSSVAFW